MPRAFGSSLARIAPAILLAVVVAGCGGGVTEPEAVEREPTPFAYDAQAPLEVQVVADEPLGGGVRIVDLSYASPPGRIDAYLVLPDGRGRYPVALFQHGGGSSRQDFIPEAIWLAQHGAASLLVQTNEAVASVREMVVDNVVAWRRGIDLLETRPEIDPSRIAMVGYSYGGGIAGLTLGAEPRISAAVIAAGIAEWKGSSLPELAPPRFIGRTSAPLLFQAGRQDDVVPPADTEAYFAAARDPKELRWYEAGHRLGEEARADRLAWVSQQLRLG